MELFRSEEMQLVQLLIPAEAAHAAAAALGDLGLLQFRDLAPGRPAFQRAFASQVQRCDEMGRRLRFLAAEVARAGLAPGPPLGGAAEMPLDELEARLARLEAEVLELSGNAERLARSHGELAELALVLDRAGGFFEDARAGAEGARAEAAGTLPPSSRFGEGADAASDIGAPLLEEATPPGSASAAAAAQLGFIAGTIPAERLTAFERLLFRATRGNVHLRAAPVGAVADPATGLPVDKAVFVVFFAGERARAKAAKAAEAYGANRYPLPDARARRGAMALDVGRRAAELGAALEAGARLRDAALRGVAAELAGWAARVRREKGIYHTLNLCSADASRKVLVAEAWAPRAAAPAARAALAGAAAAAGAAAGAVLQPVLTYDAPPTYFRTGKTTRAFQDIVDAYGIARYREANPAVFTIITFPFLFAVMFGDLGHGLLLLLVAGWLVLAEASLGCKDLGEMLGMLFGGRYVVLLMALFSLYTGAVYNEFFSIATTLFGNTRYACAGSPGITNPVAMMADPALCPSAHAYGLELVSPGAPHPFGVDPAWHGTRSELGFLNSMKMKMSVLMGVMQMNLGILISRRNQRHFGDALSTWCEFVPQLLFLNALFGYLCLLIIGKWATGSTADLYHTLIYMFLDPGNVDCAGACPENKMFAGQGFVQVLLLLVMFVAVPWMLLPKPLILRRRAEERLGGAGARGGAAYGRLLPEDGELSDAGGGGGDDGDGSAAGGPPAAHGGAHASGGGRGAGGEFDFGEVMVHQVIHTIEFVLGAISNTASYLRLWALSLAHSQLSAVFYDRVLMAAVRSGSGAGVFVGFFIFACATLGVLMVMESLSAFLHALRLHWVEFQNKFYHGDGHAFAPFSFVAADAEAAAAAQG